VLDPLPGMLDHTELTYATSWPINFLLVDALPDANYLISLRRRDAGRVTDWTPVAIHTAEDSIYGIVEAIASDSILSAGMEKVAIVSRYNAAAADRDALVTRALQFGIDSTGCVAAFASLTSYLSGLLPAWNDTTVDTPISKPEWLVVWRSWDQARAALTARLQGALGWLTACCDTNYNISATDIPTVDGYTLQHGNRVLLAGQSLTGQNGIYTAVVSQSSQPAQTLFPGVGQYSGNTEYAQYYTNGTLAYDGNLSTFASLRPPTTLNGSIGVQYSGFSGSGQATIRVILSADVFTSNASANVLGDVQYSTDFGTTWHLLSQFNPYTSDLDLSYTTPGPVNLHNILIMVNAGNTSTPYKYWDEAQQKWIKGAYTSQVGVDIKEVYLEVAASPIASTTLEYIGPVADGEVHSISEGTEYGGATVGVSRPIPDGPITLSIVVAALAPWAKAPAKPSYTAGEVGAAASSHTHSFSSLTSVPLTFTPSTHNHEYSEINGPALQNSWSVIWFGASGNPLSGAVLPIAVGGTGSDTAAGARTALGAAALAHTHTISDLPAYPTLSSLGGAAASHTHTLVSLGAAPATHTHEHTEINGPALQSSWSVVWYGAGGNPLSGAVLPIAVGGTGADTAAGARTALGVAAASHTHTPASIGAAASSHSHVIGDLPAYPTLASLGAASSSHGHTYASLTSIPSTFTPSAHNHDYSELVGPALQSSWSVLYFGAGGNPLSGAVLPIAVGGTGASSATGALTQLGAAAASHNHAYGNLTGIPSTFTPASHSHSAADLPAYPTLASLGAASSSHTHSYTSLTATGSGTSGGLYLYNPSGTRFRLTINSSNQLQLDQA